MTRIYWANDGLWQTLFFDVKLPRERLIAIRRILLAVLRGLAVARIMGLQSKAVRRELRIVEGMLRASLTDG
jgi:hypothetical protein